MYELEYSLKVLLINILHTFLSAISRLLRRDIRTQIAFYNLGEIPSQL